MTRRDTFGALLVPALLVAACDAAVAPSPSSPPSASVEATARPTAAPTTDVSPMPTVAAAASGRIAFVHFLGDSSSDIFLVDVEGSDEVRLTHDPGSGPYLVWAPDGSRLYFDSVTPTGCGDTICYPTHLVSIRSDGSDQIDLGQVGTYGGFGPPGALSPDRRFLAYPAGQGFSDDASRSFEIDALVADLLTGTIASLGIAASSVVWSPDSTRLLAAVGDQLVVVDAKSARSELHIDDPWVEPDSPVGWSADGGSVFYHRCAPELDKDEVMACMAGPSWVIDLADPNLVPRPNVGPEPAKGALSPDGRWRASFMEGELPTGLYLTPAAGGKPVLVTRLQIDGNTVEHQPSWSSDGAWLAIGIPDGIHIVPATGGELVFVTRGKAPAWQPVSP